MACRCASASTFGLPSPKSTKIWTIGVCGASVDADASTRTVSGAVSVHVNVETGAPAGLAVAAGVAVAVADCEGGAVVGPGDLADVALARACGVGLVVGPGSGDGDWTDGNGDWSVGSTATGGEVTTIAFGGG